MINERNYIIRNELTNLKVKSDKISSLFDDKLLNKEINRLKDSIDELNAKIKFINEYEEFSDKIDSIYEIVENLNNIIENLKHDKQTLENRIKYLEIENIAPKEKINNIEKENTEIKNNNILLNDKINILENENVEIKKENAEIKKENAEIKNKVDELLYNNLYNKIIIAIQDFNAYELLEKKNLNICLTKLGSNRILNSHYIDKNYVTDIKNYRIYVLYEQLLNIPVFIKNKFDLKYKNLIDDIKNFIKNDKKYNNLINIAEEDKNDAIEWWND